MLIEAFKKYTVICKGTNQKTYRWHLRVEPGYKAWKIVNHDITPKEIFNGYFIISIDVTTDKTSKSECIKVPFNKPISTNAFHTSVAQSGLGFAATPSISQSYRCQMCGGIVANDICTDCMFDWDN